MNRLTHDIAIVMLIAAAACGVPQEQQQAQVAATAGSLTRDEVCAEYMDVITRHGAATQSVETRLRADGTTTTRTTSPSLATQHLQGAEALVEFGAWGADAQDAALAQQARRISSQAQRVLHRLPPDATDARAEAVTEPLYRATTRLYVDCNAEVYEKALEMMTEPRR